MAYVKQTWTPYDTTKSEQENISSGGVGTAERMNHIEDGIGTIDSNLASHKSDKSNPHGVTASNVGLGNVKNYGIATNAEATVGTATNKYMTPFLVSEAVKSIKANVEKAQLNKVTEDTGVALIQVADTETILERIIKAGAGLKTGTASSKVSDNPTTTNMIMFVSNMVTTSGGYVIGVNTAGMSWTRTISASKWSGDWKRLVDTTQAQLNKITQDDGQAKLVVVGSNTLIGDFITKGAGFYTFVTGSATDAPELPLRGYVDMSRPGIGNVYAASDTGKVYHRFIENSKWKGEWQELVNTAQAQLKKVTADDGAAALSVADNETMLDRILGAGAGLKTGLASAKVTDSPSATSATRFLSNMIASTGGSVIAQSADGKVWSRIISGSKWHTPWEQMVQRTEFDALAQRVAALESGS